MLKYMQMGGKTFFWYMGMLFPPDTPCASDRTIEDTDFGDRKVDFLFPVCY